MLLLCCADGIKHFVVYNYRKIINFSTVKAALLHDGPHHTTSLWNIFQQQQAPKCCIPYLAVISKNGNHVAVFITLNIISALLTMSTVHIFSTVQSSDCSWAILKCIMLVNFFNKVAKVLLAFRSVYGWIAGNQFRCSLSPLCVCVCYTSGNQCISKIVTETKMFYTQNMKQI